MQMESRGDIEGAEAAYREVGSTGKLTETHVVGTMGGVLH